MPELPQKKIGIVACSGEELPEGTVSRLAALKVLERLRPGETVTICLPLFLAGGEGDRAFARFYPTIALDGCDMRCAARGTELYSNRPAASLVVTDLLRAAGLEAPHGSRRLDQAGMLAVDRVADEVAAQVDALLGQAWSRSRGEFKEDAPAPKPQEEVVATCACGSGIPIQVVKVDRREITLIALPLIFKSLLESQKEPSDPVAAELMQMVKIYNAIHPKDEPELTQVVLREYAAYCQNHRAAA
ncbi:MAG TPA: putative zinc-binding protein [Anaerolineaceae bacterium]